MRRHEVTTLGAITRLKEDNSARPTCTSEQALVGAPVRDKRWDRLTTLCDSQKHTTCLDKHYNGRLKHSHSSTDQSTLCVHCCHMEHHGNSKGTGIQTTAISNTDSNTVRSPNISGQESREFQSLCIPHPRKKNIFFFKKILNPEHDFSELCTPRVQTITTSANHRYQRCATMMKFCDCVAQSAVNPFLEPLRSVRLCE